VTTEHRKAPRRDVVEISREGAWGRVKYKHLLSCGHTEIRPRAATTPKLACAWCLKAEAKNQEMKALGAGVQTIQIDDINEKLAAEEIDISRTKAIIATRFQIPIEAIDVVATDVNGNLVIQHALLFLSASDVARLSRNQSGA
jgi:hypothetical protein